VANANVSFFSWIDPSLPEDRQNTLGDETLPASCWPDPKAMVDQLRELGVELMISPYSHSIAKTSTNFAEAEAKGLLALNSSRQPAVGFGGGYIYDLFNPAARAYAWGAMQKGYVGQYGLHHWCECCTDDTQSQYRRSLSLL
jgi:alpha-D-xyloside xylohydrolase